MATVSSRYLDRQTMQQVAPRLLVALSGLSCCGMIGVRTSVSLELLPLALSDLEIGSVGGV